ncbi:MAG TPA: hypothetical protein VJA25_14520 [Dehalococcoidia bacterium]|nr:hypothetical protein [Dehalococcoidia bacterium]
MMATTLFLALQAAVLAAETVSPGSAQPAGPGGLQGWILGLMGAAGGTVLGGIGAWALKKWGIPYYASRIREVLMEALNPTTPDPKLNELLKAHALSGVKLAEYMIPDRGKGIERFAMVDAWMAKFKVPAVIRKMLIEEAVYTMDDEAKKAIAAAEQPKP